MLVLAALTKADPLLPATDEKRVLRLWDAPNAVAILGLNPNGEMKVAKVEKQFTRNLPAPISPCRFRVLAFGEMRAVKRERLARARAALQGRL